MVGLDRVDCRKFVRVSGYTIYLNLWWNTNIDNVCARATRVSELRTVQLNQNHWLIVEP